MPPDLRLGSSSGGRKQDHAVSRPSAASGKWRRCASELSGRCGPRALRHDVSIESTMWIVEQQERVATHAIAKMQSARLSLADLELIKDLIGEVQRVTITWSSREMYSVTASNFSAQSPSIKVVRTFEAKSIADFAARAPRGKLYIMEVRFLSSEGTFVLTLGKDRDLRRDLMLSFEGPGSEVPAWFEEIVRTIVSARLMNAGQREFYLLCLTWAPVLSPLAVVPWAIAPGRLSSLGPFALLLVVAAVGWLAYTVSAPTVARFVRASSLRVRPAFVSIVRPQLIINVPSPSRVIAIRLRELRTEVKASLKDGWLAFRHGDHQFNGVLIALVALVVWLVGTVVSLIGLSK